MLLFIRREGDGCRWGGESLLFITMGKDVEILSQIRIKKATVTLTGVPARESVLLGRFIPPHSEILTSLLSHSKFVFGGGEF